MWARGVHVGYIKASQVIGLAAKMDARRGPDGAAMAMDAKLAVDGGRWPMVETDE